MKKHFAIVCAPGHGHVNPTLPLVEELVRRGHRVTYATHERFAEVVTGAGATLVPTRGDLPAPPSNGDFGPERMAEMSSQMVADARADLPELTSRLREDPPDAVCYDMMAFTGKILANELRVPGVVLIPSLASNERFSLREEAAPRNFDPYHPALQRSFQQMRVLAAEHGIDEVHPMMAKPAPLNIVSIPREFQPASETFDERFRFVGPALGARGSRDWQPANESQPLVLISLGTAFNNRSDFFRTCLEAFGDGAWQVAMAVGEHVDRAELGEIPGNVEVRSYFPQPAVLDRADAFLSHAGMNSTMESLYFGVPLLTVPQMGEQEANARRVEELGLGRQLDTTHLTPDRVRDAIEEISADEDVRANLARMRDVLRNCPGPVGAADAIEQHLAT